MPFHAASCEMRTTTAVFDPISLISKCSRKFKSRRRIQPCKNIQSEVESVADPQLKVNVVHSLSTHSVSDHSDSAPYELLKTRNCINEDPKNMRNWSGSSSTT
jgi:hypothetical protein